MDLTYHFSKCFEQSSGIICGILYTWEYEDICNQIFNEDSARAIMLLTQDKTKNINKMIGIQINKSKFCCVQDSYPWYFPVCPYPYQIFQCTLCSRSLYVLPYLHLYHPFFPTHFFNAVFIYVQKHYLSQLSLFHFPHIHLPLISISFQQSQIISDHFQNLVHLSKIIPH